MESSSHKELSGNSLAGIFRGAYFGALGWIGYKVMLCFLVALTIACSFISLLNLLAYEFAAVISLFVCHFTAILVIRELDRLRPILTQRSPYSPGPHPRLVVWGVVLGVMAAVGWLLFLPLIGILLLDLIRQIRNCDLLTGFGFYFTIPLISSFLCAGLGTLCGLGTSSRKSALVLYWLIVLILVARIIVRLAHGHVYGMNEPLVGNLGLPMYESEANLDSGFVNSRLLVLLVGYFLISLSILFADPRFQRYSPRNILSNLRKADIFLPEIHAGLISLVLVILTFYFQGPLGIEITRNYLEHVLDGRIVTEHFVIRYPTGGEVEEDIERVAEQHEFYYWSIVNEIEVAPEGLIRAYIYPDRATKSRLTGVGRGVYAKPWTGEIHVEYKRNRIGSLKHELVHVVSAPMGLPFFGSSLLGAFGEGIAEGIEWRTGNDLTYHQWAASLREAIDPLTGEPFFPRDSGPLKLLTSNVQPGGFYAGRISMNYYLAASHTRWMLDMYGIEAYKAAYMRNNTMQAVGMSQQDEADAWMNFLDHVPLTTDDIEFAAMGFALPKFAVRVCAHELSEHERIAEELIAQQRYLPALDEYIILLGFSPGNIRYGYRQALMLYYAEEFDEALDLVRDLQTWEQCDSGWKPYFLLLEGDIQARADQPLEAARLYQEAIDEGVNATVDERAILRLEMLDSPALEEFLAAMKEPEDARWRYERARAVDTTWLPAYFLGIELTGDREYETAQEYLLDCLRQAPLHTFVRRTCLYYLGICAYYQEEYELAKQNFQDSVALSGDIFLEEHPAYDGLIPLHRLDSWSSNCADWLSRCVWRETWPGIATQADE